MKICGRLVIIITVHLWNIVQQVQSFETYRDINTRMLNSYPSTSFLSITSPLHKSTNTKYNPYKNNYSVHPFSRNYLQKTSVSPITPLSMSLSSLSPLFISKVTTQLQILRNAIPNSVYLGTSIALLLGYHVRLYRIETSSASSLSSSSSSEKVLTPTWRTTQANTRALWSKHVRETEGWLYAVQTLRNAITANTFLATTVLSLLTVIGGKIWDLIRSTSTNKKLRQLLMAQLGAVSFTMLSSAYHFLQSARLMTHAGFMFPVSKGTKVDRIMMKSQNAQWLGLRWLYVSLAMISWAVGGEQLLFLSSLALIRFFSNVDRAPSDMKEE